MATIDLKIVADSTQAVQEINKITETTKTMQRTVQEGEKRQKGLIEDVTEALKKYEVARDKAMTTEGIAKQNKKIAEAKQTLKEYNEVGVETVTTQQKIGTATNGLWNAFKKLILPILTITTLFKALKAIFASTQQTADFLKREIEGIKVAGNTLARAIATWNFEKLGEKLRGARKAGKDYADQMDEIGDLERELQIKESRRAVELANLAKIYRNTALTGAEGFKKRQEAAEEYIRVAEEGEKEAIGLLQMRLDAELKLAREQAGYTQEYKEASEERKKAINDEILSNLTMQSTFMQNKQGLENYEKAIKGLRDLGGPWVKMDVQNAIDLYKATGQLTNQIKQLPEVEQGWAKEYLESIKNMPPELEKTSKEFLKWGLITDDVRVMMTNTMVTIEQREAELARGTIRANTTMEMANYQLAQEEKKTNEERLKQAEKFSDELQRLWAEYSKAQIDSLTGEEQIKAQEAFTIAQIDEEENKLKKRGEINEEGIKMLAALRQFAHQQAIRDIKQYNAEQLAEWEETYKRAGNELLDNLDFRKDIELQALELSGEETEAKRLEIENKYLAAQRDLYLKAGAMYDPMVANWIQGIIDSNKKLIESSDFNFWEAIGVTDTDEQDKIKENIKIAIDQITGMLDEMFAKRVEDAQRRRELLETEIDDTQNALDQEIELAKLGYANNVDAKKKELEELNKARDKAIKDEERALKAQQEMDTAMQITTLITASAEILAKTIKMTKNPVLGLLLGALAIASMWAIFAKSKADAKKATKLAEGGVGTKTGMIGGRSHQQGGEPFLNHVEVERGEMWGVLSKSASAKHGKEFAQIVTSFNKDNLVIERTDAPNNYINVDVNQTNSRLDKVENQLIKLNRHFAGQKEVHETTDMRIEKIGNKTRIIRK
jgi:hypothetical protein